MVHVEGRADDAFAQDSRGRSVGGVVAAVEVSWSGGARWHEATLEALVGRQARWSVTWGDAVIGARRDAKKMRKRRKEPGEPARDEL